MNKKGTKAVAAVVGTAMFAGMLVSGVGTSAKQVEAINNNQVLAGTGSTWVNFMNPVYDNGTNIQVFKTDYGYGAWATDSNGNVIGNEPVAKTAYYIPTIGTAGRDTDYGDFVASYEVNVTSTLGGNTIQTYYDEANFAWNVTDHYDHFGNALPLYQNAYTSAALLDEKGGIATPYIFEFDFGDYNPYYVEFVGTKFSPTTKVVSNDQIGVWTDTKWPDFGAYADIVEDWDDDGVVDFYIPEVYQNPVFEDAHSFAHSDALWIGEPEAILGGYDDWREEFLPGQIMPPADENGCFWGNIDYDFEPDHLGDIGSLAGEIYDWPW